MATELFHVTYVIKDGSGMYGVEPPAARHTVDLELETAGLDEQAIIEQIKQTIHDRTDGCSVVVEAYRDSD